MRIEKTTGNNCTHLLAPTRVDGRLVWKVSPCVDLRAMIKPILTQD
jgi:hypothetical protein